MKTMGKSTIGYCGTGADGKPSTEYFSWNSCGFGGSRGCDGYWARAMNGAALAELLSQQAKRDRAAKGTPARQSKKAGRTLGAAKAAKEKNP